jgi:hypothetical protein
VNKKLFYPLIVLGFTLVLLIPLFSKQLLYTDDAELHAARVANYYLAIKQKQIPPRWAPNLNSSYGYPVLNFAYPLPYMTSAFIYMALPVTIALALNLTIVLLVAFGTIGIYYLARQFSLSTQKSTLAAGLYLTAPYSLINIYSRTALGEIAFFAILPWVMWGVENFIRKKRTSPILYLFLTISLAFLLLSHQTSLIITFPILAIYYWLRMKNKKQTISLIKRIAPTTIISLLITAWYWVPAIWEKQYVILDRADTITNYLVQFPQHWSFFFHPATDLDRLNTFLMTSIGYSSWAIFLSSLWLITNKKVTNKNIIVYLLGTMILAVVLMMPFTRPIWLISGLGNYLQYPWRLLSLLTLGVVLLFIHLSQTKIFKHSYWLTGILIITSGLSIIAYAQPRGFQNWSDYELLEYFKTTTTFNEFQPIWAAQYTRHFPAEKISFRVPQEKLYNDEVLQAADYADLKIQDWNGSQMSYLVETNQPVEVIQKTYYFPGWELMVDGQERQIQHQDEEFPGHITYSLQPGQHQVQLDFTQNTPARKAGAIAFFVGLISLALMLL